MDSLATPHNIIAARSAEEGKEGTKGEERVELHLPFSTLPLWNIISAPAATFLATCVARREQRAR